MLYVLLYLLFLLLRLPFFCSPEAPTWTPGGAKIDPRGEPKWPPGGLWARGRPQVAAKAAPEPPLDGSWSALGGSWGHSWPLSGRSRGASSALRALSLEKTSCSLKCLNVRKTMISVRGIWKTIVLLKQIDAFVQKSSFRLSKTMIRHRFSSRTFEFLKEFIGFHRKQLNSLRNFIEFHEKQWSPSENSLVFTENHRSSTNFWQASGQQSGQRVGNRATAGH